MGTEIKVRLVENFTMSYRELVEPARMSVGTLEHYFDFFTTYYYDLMGSKEFSIVPYDSLSRRISSALDSCYTEATALAAMIRTRRTA